MHIFYPPPATTFEGSQFLPREGRPSHGQAPDQQPETRASTRDNVPEARVEAEGRAISLAPALVKVGVACAREKRECFAPHPPYKRGCLKWYLRRERTNLRK